MTTVPGVLTALAGLVTAAGAVWVGLATQSAEPAPQPNATMTITQGAPDTTGPPPVSSGDADSLRLDSADGLQMDNSATGLVDACAQGDEVACAQLLTALVNECADGIPESCDALYLLSPVGSLLEEYGATCGYRFSAAVAGTCEYQ